MRVQRGIGITESLTIHEAADLIEQQQKRIDELTAALWAVSDDWDGEHFHEGGESFIPAVNRALGRE